MKVKCTLIAVPVAEKMAYNQIYLQRSDPMITEETTNQELGLELVEKNVNTLHVFAESRNNVQ